MLVFYDRVRHRKVPHAMKAVPYRGVEMQAHLHSSPSVLKRRERPRPLVGLVGDDTLRRA